MLYVCELQTVNSNGAPLQAEKARLFQQPRTVAVFQIKGVLELMDLAS